MEEAIKRFNLIDFLSIFAPGALVGLCANYYWIDILLPVRKLFGENTVMLGLCFFGLSFLLGSALHTLGSFLESLILVLFPALARAFHREYLNTESVQKAYKEIFNENIADLPSGKEFEICRNIYRYLQRKERPERIVLFTAYSSMSRTLVVALSTVLTLLLFFDSHNMSMLILCGICIILFSIRWRHYEKLRIVETYTLFKAVKIFESREKV